MAGKCNVKRAERPERDLFTMAVRSMFRVDCLTEYRFHPVRKWRFDYAIPEHRIAIEVEGGVWTGGRHTRAAGFLGDMEKYNTATVMGWRVIRTTPERLMTGETFENIKKLIET